MKQIQEWEAYDKIDPIGTWRDDFRMAQLATVFVNMMIWAHGKKGAPQAKLIDYMPDWRGGREKVQEVQSVEEMKKFLLGFAKRHNKRIGIQPRPPVKSSRHGHREINSDLRD